MIAFSIGPIDIHRYGIMYLLAFWGGYIFAHSVKNRTLRNQTPNLQKILQHKIDDIIFVIFLWVMIGGRAGHVLIYDFDYFVQNPADIIAFRKWGMSFIGWLIGVIIAIVARSRKQWCTRAETKSLGDIILSFVPFGIFVWRIGNFLNQELYGILVPSNMRNLPLWLTNLLQQIHLLHVYDRIDTALRVNTNMLAALGEWLLLLIVGQYLLRKQKKTNKIIPGIIAASFLTGYSIIRFVLEYLRQDSQAEFVAYFSKSQYFFLFFGMIWLMRLRSICKKTISTPRAQTIS